MRSHFGVAGVAMLLVDWEQLRIRLPEWRRLGLALAVPIVAVFIAVAPLKWSIVGLAGSAAVIAMVCEPALTLVALALAIPLGSALPLPGVGGANAVDALAAVAIVAWFARSAARRRLLWQRPPLVPALVLFLWASALSLTQALNWREGLAEWLKWAEYVVVYLVASQLLDGPRRWWVVSALFAAGLAEAALGAYQFLRQVGPESFVLMGRFMRAYGSFRQPNPYAGYLGYLALPAASLAIAAAGAWLARQSRSAVLVALASAGVALALCAGIGMSWSRGAWLGLGAGLLTIVALRSRLTATVSAGIVVVTLVALTVYGTGWVPSAISTRMADLVRPDAAPDHTEITDENFAVMERLAHWQAAQAMFGDHPWFGVGLGNYSAAYAAYALPLWYEPLGHAHNIYLNFLAETGSAGFAAFLLMWLSSAWLAWRTSRQSQGLHRALAIGVVGSIAFVSVHNGFDNLFVAHLQLQLALLIAAVVAPGVPRPPKPGRASGI